MRIWNQSSMNSLSKFYPMKRTGNVMRLLRNKVAEEIHIFKLMKERKLEHTNWHMTNQVAFIAGMKYMKAVIEDPITHDVFFVPEDHLSKTFKNNKKTAYQLAGVDNPIDDK